VIIGIGTDLVKIERIAASIERWGDRFVHKILAESEMLAYQQNPSAAFVAKRFAAKEAVAKALATGMSCGVHFVQIAVVNHAPEAARSFQTLIRARHDIVAAWTLTGEADFLLRVYCSDLSELNRLVQDVFLPHPAVARVQSQIVMEQTKPDAPLPI